ncbi:MAG: DUF3857 domain-containing protein [Saprospiraceae bacterium]|nr:DUF3857 domain-containing protein [Saprospiraceae bacterium]
MKKSIFVILLLTSFSNIPLFSQLYYPAAIDDKLKEDANSVIRHEEVFFKVKSTSEGTYHFKQIITILNKKSSDNVLYIPYDKDSKVTEIKATLYNNFGQKVRKIKPSEVKDYSAIQDFSIYQDDRFKYLEVKHGSFPYTVEFEYEMNLKGMSFINFKDWYIQGFSQSVEYGKYQLEIPKDQEFHYEALNFDGTPKVREEKNKQIYLWEVKDLMAMEREPYGPRRFDVLPVLWLSPGEFRIDQYKGTMNNWNEFGQFMNKLIADRDELPSTLVTEVKSLVAHAKTDQEKIDLLYNYLQENMRYVSVQLGIGGWQPFDATYVSEKKYGDCKALSNFMKAILKAVDIESYPVLIANGNLDYEVTEDFTTPRFNHMVLHVPSEDYWLECTSPNFPPNYLGSRNSDRNVMLVTPDGGKLVKTPSLKAEDNQDNHKSVILLKPDGSAEVAVDIYASGSSHETYRGIQSGLSNEEKEKWLTKISDLPSFTIQAFSIEPSKMKPEVKVHYNLMVSRYAAKAGKRLFVPLNAINNWDYIPPALKERKHHVFRENAFWDRDEIILDIPEGYQIESVPVEEKRVEAPIGYYDVKVFQRGKQLVMNREIKLESGEYPANEYEGIRQFFKEVSKLDAMKVVLVEKKT